jgi:hypothetical protein
MNDGVQMAKFEDLWHGEPRTLRDWFAGQAMAGMVSCQDFMNEAVKFCESKERARQKIAEFAYKQADAMILERSKTPDPDSPLWGEQHKET